MGFAYDYLTGSSGGMGWGNNWIGKMLTMKYGPRKGLMEKYGLENPYTGMEEDILGLERVASRGLDPNEFGKRYGAQTASAGRSIVGQTNTAVGGAALGLGDNLMSGGLDRIQAEGAGARVGVYGDLLTRMRSEDYAISSDAKNQLLEMIMAKQQMESTIAMTEAQIRVQTGGY